MCVYWLTKLYRKSNSISELNVWFPLEQSWFSVTGKPVPLFPSKQLQGNGSSTNVSLNLHTSNGDVDVLGVGLRDLEGETKLEGMAEGLGVLVKDTDCELVEEVLGVATPNVEQVEDVHSSH